MSEAVGQVARVRGSRAARRRLHRIDALVSPYLYVGSFFLVFCAFGLFPLGYTAWMSLTDRNLLNPTTHFVGLDNYTALLHDSYFWNAVENTLGIWVLSTIPQLLLALALAHLINTKLRGRTFFRMSVLLPQVTSLVAVALIFTQLFSRLRAVQLPARRDRDRPGRLGGRTLLVVGRALRDGHVAVDRATTRSSTSPPCRRSRTTSTSRPRSTARDAGGSSGTSPCR